MDYVTFMLDLKEISCGRHDFGSQTLQVDRDMNMLAQSKQIFSQSGDVHFLYRSPPGSMPTWIGPHIPPSSRPRSSVNYQCKAPRECSCIQMSRLINGSCRWITAEGKEGRRKGFFFWHRKVREVLAGEVEVRKQFEFKSLLISFRIERRCRSSYGSLQTQAGIALLLCGLFMMMWISNKLWY